MKIVVTQQNINKGLRGSCSSDPVSLAMKEAGLCSPWVSPAHISWRSKSKDYTVPTPDEVLVFIKGFDNNVSVEPFEFELEEA